MSDWRVNLVVASDASAIIAPVADDGKSARGLTRALDLMYSNNGMEGIRPLHGESNDGPLYPPVLTIGPQSAFESGAYWDDLGLVRLLKEQEWHHPESGLFRLVKEASNASLGADIQRCITENSAEPAANTCRWEDEGAHNRVVTFLLQEFTSDVDEFKRTSTLNDHPSKMVADRLFQLGQFLVIINLDSIDAEIARSISAEKHGPTITIEMSGHRSGSQEEWFARSVGDQARKLTPLYVDPRDFDESRDSALTVSARDNWGVTALSVLVSMEAAENTTACLVPLDQKLQSREYQLRQRRTGDSLRDSLLYFINLSNVREALSKCPGFDPKRGWKYSFVVKATNGQSFTSEYTFHVHSP
jgi:hypothetical protein